MGFSEEFYFGLNESVVGAYVWVAVVGLDVLTNLIHFFLTINWLDDDHPMLDDAGSTCWISPFKRPPFPPLILTGHVLHVLQASRYLPKGILLSCRWNTSTHLRNFHLQARTLFLLHCKKTLHVRARPLAERTIRSNTKTCFQTMAHYVLEDEWSSRINLSSF